MLVSSVSLLINRVPLSDPRGGRQLCRAQDGLHMRGESSSSFGMIGCRLVNADAIHNLCRIERSSIDPGLIDSFLSSYFFRSRYAE